MSQTRFTFPGINGPNVSLNSCNTCISIYIYIYFFVPSKINFSLFQILLFLLWELQQIWRCCLRLSRFRSLLAPEAARKTKKGTVTVISKWQKRLKHSTLAKQQKKMKRTNKHVQGPRPDRPILLCLKTQWYSVFSEQSHPLIVFLVRIAFALHPLKCAANVGKRMFLILTGFE